MESTRIKVCKTSELLSGQSTKVDLNGKEVGVFNVNGKYYAIDNMCIHAGGPLHEGAIDTEQCQVMCAWHGWTFDLASGKCVSHARQDVFSQTYKVIVEDDVIYVM